MNSNEPADYSTANEEASLWAARLDGSELTAADREELEIWLAKDERHRSLLSHYCQISIDLETSLPALVASGSVAVLSAKPSTRPPPRPFRLLGICAAALIVVAAVGVIVLKPLNGPRHIATAIAQHQAVTLEDGTRAELNARTTLEMSSSSSERRVRLAEGEAFFSVTKDKSRPFIVETPAGSVRVTGTVFAVRCETNSDFEVTVVEGSVQVRPSDAGGARAPIPVSLSAGDRLSARPSGVTVSNLSAEQVSDALAWREGQIVLVGTPLAEALERFAHYHGRGITITPGAAGLRTGGRHRLDDLDGFLAYVTEAFSTVRVSRDLSGNIRVSLRTEP